MIRYGVLMIGITLMLSACSQPAVVVDETATPTESIVIAPTVEDPPTTAEPPPTLEPSRTPLPSPLPFPSPTLEPSPTAGSVTIEIPADPNAAANEWTSFTYQKALDYQQGFMLHYPRSWALMIKITNSGLGYLQMRLNLEKLGYEIRIAQGPGSEGRCLYPEDPESEGFVVRYRKYVEIEKENAIVWRRARSENNPDDAPLYRVCELNQEKEYGFPATRIGWIDIKSPIVNGLILSEIDEILRRIEILD